MLMKFNEIDYDIKFSFNSFKYLEDFNMGDLNDIQFKPFKIISVTRQLLMASINNDPKKQISYDDVDGYLETVMEEGDIAELLEKLIKLLEESNFFKSLQKKPKKKK